MIRTLAAFALAGVAALAIASQASAANPNAFVFTLDCGEDGDIRASLGGGGKWAPVRVLDREGRFFVPVAFSNQHGTFTGDDGSVEMFEEEDTSRHVPRDPELLNCSFDITFDVRGGSVQFAGDVEGYIR